MNNMLLLPFSKEKIKAIVFQMGPYKAPCPTGYGACFYQRYWSMVRDEACEAILSFLNYEQDMSAINYTYLVMIPKHNNPKNITKYRPISLCNVLHKIVTKLLANRMKEIMPAIISQNHCAFIPGTQISNNILAAYETLHTMKIKLHGNKGYMTIKLDMSKAYDRIEWRFLKEAMLKIGF